VFLTHNIKEPYMFLSNMICKLYGEENNIHLKREWTLVAHYVEEKGHIFNWDHLLSINILKTVRRAPTLKIPGFFMSYYLIDVICVAHHFLGMDWEWNPIFSQLMFIVSNYGRNTIKKHMYETCEHFLVPLYVIIYKQNPLRIST
jgi:hypothetical protein